VPFVPAPIIDKATSLNFEHWVHKKSMEEVYVYFIKIKNYDIRPETLPGFRQSSIFIHTSDLDI